MRHTLLKLSPLLFFAFSVFGQGTPSIQFTETFTSAGTTCLQAACIVSNGPTLNGGPQGAVAFRLVYYIQPGTGTVSALSIELDGAATSGGSYTALTPAAGGGSGSGSTLNPVTTFPNGQNVMCCDYYPFLELKVNTLTVASGTPVLIIKVIGYAGTSAATGAGSGGSGGSVTWNGILSPNGNQALTMAAFTSTWQFGAATGAATDMVTIEDTGGNTGTGLLLHITTAAGSAASPWKADANGVGCSINASGIFNCTAGSAAIFGGSTLYNMGPEGISRTQIQGTTAQSSGQGIVRFSADVQPPSLNFAKSRGASIGTQTAVLAGDQLGIQIFAGSDGTNFVRAAEVLIQAQAGIGPGVVPGAYSIYTSNASGVITDALQIDSAQNTTFFGGMIATVAAPTVAASQIGYGSTTAATANCGALLSAVACIVVNIAGVVHYVPYY